MFIPSNRKYKKEFKGVKSGKRFNVHNTYSNSELSFGTIGLKAIESGRMSSQQMEMMRRILARHFKKDGKVFINVFAHKPVSKKPAEVRMGGGKGAVEKWIDIIRPGKILVELFGIDNAIARPVLESLKYKLQFKVKVVEPNLTEVI